MTRSDSRLIVFMEDLSSGAYTPIHERFYPFYATPHKFVFTNFFYEEFG
jgi:hypothetical protein